MADPPAGGTNDPFSIRDSMLKYTKNDPNVFFCPANDLPSNAATGAPPFDVPDFVSSTSATAGRFGYWWCANPYFPGSTNQDLSAATLYYHQDSAAGDSGPPPVGNTARPCTPGIDYMRKMGDKNSATITICTDQSRQQTAAGVVWYWMHGTGSTSAVKSWKNNLFGDGHADSRRGAEIIKRWGLTNPAAW